MGLYQLYRCVSDWLFRIERMQRFWSKADKSGDCWNWTASRFADGYGQFKLNKKNWRAHRLAYTLAHGEIPADMCVCHRCDNRKCVNPDHLFLGTVQDNVADMDSKNRRGATTKNNGSGCGMAKLTESDVALIRASYPKVNGVQLARRFNVSNSTIYRILRNQRWVQ